MIPRQFALRYGHRAVILDARPTFDTDRVAIYPATAAYMGFWMPTQEPRHIRQTLTLCWYVPDTPLIQDTLHEWTVTGEHLFTASNASPIPILGFYDGAEKRPPFYDLLLDYWFHVYPGTNRDYPIWGQYHQNLARIQPKSEPKPKPKPIPAFVAEALIAAAIKQDATCPISMEPLHATGATVTSCFHLFNTPSLAFWRKTSDTCPVCKEICSLTTPRSK